MKKTYSTPYMNVEPMILGVFGSYGCGDDDSTPLNKLPFSFNNDIPDRRF